MDVPAHYRRFFRALLRYAVVMTLVGLLTGILFQESTKRLPAYSALPAGAHLESMLSLALVHGHTFLLGVLLPLAFAWMLYLGQNQGYRELSPRVLGWTKGLYLTGATAAILLMLFKGYHLVLGVRHGQMDFDVLNQSFFFGSRGLRAAVYGLAHSSMAFGAGTFAVAYWRSMGTEA